MPGFRQFVTGEVLTASNVDDFLAKQSVMKFADAAARNSALGTATGGSNALREGMVAYLDDTDELVKYDGAAWASVVAGIGSNVVQTVKTDTFSTSSETFVEVTGLAATITPTSASSKILVIAYYMMSSSETNRSVNTRLVRGATPLFVGDADGSRLQTSAGNGTDAQQTSTGVTLTFLDSPAVATATTYAIEMRRGSSSTVHIGRDGFDGDSVNSPRSPSSITLIEVAA